MILNAKKGKFPRFFEGCESISGLRSKGNFGDDIGEMERDWPPEPMLKSPALRSVNFFAVRRAVRPDSHLFSLEKAVALAQ